MREIKVGSRVVRRRKLSRVRIGIVERMETKHGQPQAYVRWLDGTRRYNGNSATRSSVRTSDLMPYVQCHYCQDRPSSLMPCPECDS